MATVIPSTLTKVLEVNDRSDFLAMADEWNELVQVTNNLPYYRHEFIRIWLDNFAPNAKLRILTARDQIGRLSAILPLISERSSLYGIPVRQLISPANSHSGRLDLIAKDGENAGRLFFSHLSADQHWDLLKVIDVPQDGNAWHLYRAAQASGFPSGVWGSQRSPYLCFPSSYEELIQNHSAQFRETLRRRRRRLSKLGTISFEHVKGGTELLNRLTEGFEIEQSGWKGKNGTAIANQKSTYNFYWELARTAAEKGFLSLFFLKLNNISVAFQLGFSYEGAYYLQKTGYDETFKECSPGLLLMDEIIKECFSRGINKIDFLGDDSEWKMKWASGVLPHSWFFIFPNNSVGRALQKVKFTLVPAIKKMLGRGKDD